LAEIALAVRHALAQRRLRGEPGRTAAQVLARGEGWTVSDVVCTAGPHDPLFEEQHTGYSIAIVLTGSFQYRSTLGDALMTPGSLMLGNAGQCFECGHEHGEGDRCVSFWYEPRWPAMGVGEDRVVSPRARASVRESRGHGCCVFC
jgi:AraC family transcriptional regulator